MKYISAKQVYTTETEHLLQSSSLSQPFLDHSPWLTGPGSLGLLWNKGTNPQFAICQVSRKENERQLSISLKLNSFRRDIIHKRLVVWINSHIILGMSGCYTCEKSCRSV